MLRLREMIRKVGSSRVSVLLQGESGTGKELVARAIYAARPRGEFVPIDCGSLAPTLIESELFGHQRGAFTGAIGSRAGLLQTAHGGTAFFDEIGELPAEAQVKLLRVLQQQEIRPVGSNRSQPCSFRVIAATNRNLEEEVRCGRFRLDLYFRLNVVALELPPLRHRKEDISGLIEDFLQKNGYRHEITPEVLEAMMAYWWPGNIRELHNCVDRLVALSSDQYLHIEDLQFHRVLADSRSSSRIEPEPEISTLNIQAGPATARQDEPRDSEVIPAGSMESAELAAVQRALSSADGNMTDAAQLLGIGRTTLYRKLKRYDLDHGPAWREGILVYRKLRPVNLADILNERRLSVLGLAGSKVEVRFRIDAQMPSIKADPAEIQQVIKNLVQNAVEATGSAGVIDISASVSELSEDTGDEGLPAGRYVHIQVKNMGPGMPADVVAKAFDPFFTTKFLGRGLGLTAALRIMRAHNGAVRLETVPDSGTIVHLYFPVETTEHAPAFSGSRQPALGFGYLERSVAWRGPS